MVIVVLSWLRYFRNNSSNSQHYQISDIKSCRFKIILPRIWLDIIAIADSHHVAQQAPSDNSWVIVATPHIIAGWISESWVILIHILVSFFLSFWLQLSSFLHLFTDMWDSGKGSSFSLPSKILGELVLCLLTRVPVCTNSKFSPILWLRLWLSVAALPSRRW